MFTLEFSACFLGTWAGFDSHSRHYQENNKQVIFTLRCLKLPLMFHYEHIQGLAVHTVQLEKNCRSKYLTAEYYCGFSTNSSFIPSLIPVSHSLIYRDKVP